MLYHQDLAYIFTSARFPPCAPLASYNFSSRHTLRGMNITQSRLKSPGTWVDKCGVSKAWVWSTHRVSPQSPRSCERVISTLLRKAFEGVHYIMGLKETTSKLLFKPRLTPWLILIHQVHLTKQTRRVTPISPLSPPTNHGEGGESVKDNQSCSCVTHQQEGSTNTRLINCFISDSSTFINLEIDFLGLEAASSHLKGTKSLHKVSNSGIRTFNMLNLFAETSSQPTRLSHSRSTQYSDMEPSK